MTNKFFGCLRTTIRTRTKTRARALLRPEHSKLLRQAAYVCQTLPAVCKRQNVFANICSFCTKMPFLLFAVYKIKIFCTFLQNNLHISKKSSTFAP